MRFNVYRSAESAKPVLIGNLDAADATAAYSAARLIYGEGPFILRTAKTRNELTAYIAANSFKRGHDRVGAMVYQAPSVGKRAKQELVILENRMHLYSLAPRQHKQEWDLV